MKVEDKTLGVLRLGKRDEAKKKIAEEQQRLLHRDPLLASLSHCLNHGLNHRHSHYHRDPLFASLSQTHSPQHLCSVLLPNYNRTVLCLLAQA